MMSKFNLSIIIVITDSYMLFINQNKKNLMLRYLVKKITPSCNTIVIFLAYYCNSFVIFNLFGGTAVPVQMTRLLDIADRKTLQT